MLRHEPTPALGRFSLGILVLVIARGCLPGGPDIERPPDASTPLPSPSTDAGSRRPMALVARDARGERWPLDSLPRRVALELEAARSAEGRPAVFLFEGPADAALLADLARWPLLVANAERSVPALVGPTEDGTSLTPEAPLALGARYTLAVAAWALDDGGEARGEPTIFELRVAERDAGAVVVETWPAAGTYGVPQTIPFLAVRFDDVVEGVDGVRILTEAGATVAGEVSTRPCLDLALAPGTCVALVPLEPLPEDTGIRIEIGTTTVDRTGAPVGPFSASIRTAKAGDLAPPPTLEALPCTLDEAPLEGACAIGFDTQVRVRARASGPVRARLAVGEQTLATAAPRGDFAFTVDGLAPGGAVSGSLSVVGLDGRELRATWVLETEADLPRVFITEVRADPEGPEPDQEYVEVHNASDASIDLGGFRITDDATRAGDLIAAPAWLPARGYALLVGSGFDPERLEDDRVPPGIPLFRLDASIAGAGLSNEGEPLYLRDASGRRVSAAPATAAPAAGVCIARAVSDGRSDEPSAFVAHPAGRCGPGEADVLAGVP